ncbi:UTP--glucose-1-phosphate uridylyltransferase GalU [Sinorhizobium americanum]|uniref:UTP--glucose-1-phosphate uridylyltransferase n=1 Tax=Sinorhizobium americanum TaxID=194963 RepID=A0A1L3LQW9_9HYPH|nr:UTP--glucose-1-phosphate uridylyltransferase GalU [Sinorhizobium americanum]APG85845.1 UTP--glucose-1-phosphate uridylyltransferase ExoN [Sinorhizobium americanum CCGM7]APG92502.1 UTP--glucose-1-phosphate uridylyltransferase ExoN [Sinorhizobium americanum]OAP35371.1 UTP--glucose-1-phosphate uridylyltransferase [Sinorhizobium americanum]TCN24275.1 UDP-glucose pyrophosphorylase [Sinorhizobium americanum]
MTDKRKVRKAVFPVAGLGTRFLPATKAVPKEMLTVVDKPVIQYVVDEALEAGIEHLIFVTGRSKAVIEDYFDIQVELDQTLRERNKRAEIELLEAILPKAGTTSFTRQQAPLGLGHAVWCARDLVGNEPFALLLPDMIMKGEKGCLKGMVELYEHSGGNVIAVEECAPDQAHKYGIVGVGDRVGDGFKITKMVEKPAPGTAPSNFFINGRYILQPNIFPILERQERGAGNEIQLTDGMVKLSGEQPFAAYHFRGETFDCGAKDGFILANVAFALERADIRPTVEGPLKTLLHGLK